MTLSIIGRCAQTGQIGIAISSSSIAVGARCPWLRSKVGAVSTQNITLPALGPRILDRLQQGDAAETALQFGLDTDDYFMYRQVTVLTASGESAFYSGEKTLGVNHALRGENCVAAGNLLANTEVITAMVNAFEQQSGHLADRLIAAMQAGLQAGGEAGPVHSAALSIVDSPVWPIVDLRVDWTDADPIAELSNLWHAYKPQMQDYLTRALDPRSAPGYGVPGDE
ncbi:DUF1028 domain-containing protein [Kosakonia radicincitans]|uniref:Uncharacterized conserved protein, Ntn-hydrolase superfamily n=1 Tax=Kosakonia radicincitans TaxID=283686 RepID=A0AAX2ERM6_9ENTR|nr:DUF1028 domain-containing protein [Kosakonia radicincitans]MDP9567535.1 putative Ntn-hydrolase superfamily protein [Kosakonia oryzae]QEM91347.1 DUF1028 domain-containing protein [Kosakonia radicincitans]SFE91042.1 Uncharacterized conserved protein, Ntn-hydrolase superfamily [Kosakonia radicincitans]SFR11290.1 Uncharacterized conserved protein, Ntn-hydrolase superfamily [Kosakonia radicincitans]SFT94444.1 Uncharacterized conserved protein, Ntn-hydrolase superfamily [Kosakonia radicincitans]